MKTRIYIFFLSFLLFNSASADMKLPERIQKQIQGDQGFSIVSLDTQLLPQEMKNTFFENIINMKTQGYFEVDEQLLGKLETALSMSDDTLSSFDEIKDQVGFTPLNISGTALDHLVKNEDDNHKKPKLVGATISGSIVDGKSSGLFRLFSVPDFGLIGLSENDFSLSGGGLKMYMKAINTEVNGNPAVFTVKKSKNNLLETNLRENIKDEDHINYVESELTWSNGTKIYNLVSNKMITSPELKKKFIKLAESLH